MIRAIATLESVSPYSQSKHLTEPKKDRELPKDYEERCWRKRLHVNAQNNVFIPPMSFKLSLAEAAKYLSIQVPGKGKQTYTKHFDAGVLVVDPLILPLVPEDVEGEWLFLNADGKRGSGTRVDKCYPRIDHWVGDVEYLILDEIITEDVFQKVLTESGRLIGIGRFRPRNGGYYGRFKVNEVKWISEE